MSGIRTPPPEASSDHCRVPGMGTEPLASCSGPPKTPGLGKRRRPRPSKACGGHQAGAGLASAPVPTSAPPSRKGSAFSADGFSEPLGHCDRTLPRPVPGQQLVRRPGSPDPDPREIPHHRPPHPQTWFYAGTGQRGLEPNTRQCQLRPLARCGRRKQQRLTLDSELRELCSGAVPTTNGSGSTPCHRTGPGGAPSLPPLRLWTCAGNDADASGP